MFFSSFLCGEPGISTTHHLFWATISGEKISYIRNNPEEICTTNYKVMLELLSNVGVLYI